MTNSTATYDSRIVIVGAGPGGLLAARVLQRAGVPVTVVDADRSIDDRNPGGTLDLHADTGQLALEIAGLSAEFAALARPEGQHKVLVDAATGALIKNFVPDPGEYAAPEIDRGQLRTLLYQSVAAGTVQWDRKLATVEPDPKPGADAWVLHFADGSTETADLVIGADGAWSRVRPAITAARPGYTGVSFAELLFSDVDRSHPEVAALVGDGHLWANGDSKNVILQRNSNQVVRGYLGTRIELDWLARAGLGEHDGRGGIRLDENGLQALDTSAVRAELLRRFDDFAPQLRQLIIESEGELANRPIFALPAPLRWDHVRAITLLGDAAHLMSPFGGNGVNFALLDAAVLTQAVVRALREGSDIDQVLARYESAMFERTGQAAVATNDAITRKYRAGGSAIADLPDFSAEFARWKQAAAASSGHLAHRECAG